MIGRGRVSWFRLDKKFGFIELEGIGDAFLHVSVLKSAGYVSVLAGTTMRVRIEQEQGRRRVTAFPDQAPPVRRKPQNKMRC